MEGAMKTLLISTGAVALLLVSTSHATGQTRVTPKARAQNGWVQPRTPWGDPDLQETWSTEDLRDIPYERPDEFAGRAVLTDDEFAAREAQARRAAERTQS